MFPWLGALPESTAAAYQDIFEALFVDPRSDEIVAMSQRPEYRPFVSTRAEVRRVPSGWPIDSHLKPDYERPDEWRIEFVETSSAEDNASAEGGRFGAGDEALPDTLHPRIVRRWWPYLVHRMA